MNPKFSRLPIALSLLLTLTCCSMLASKPVNDACPPPVWPDIVTATWLIDTPHPPAVSQWKDKNDRLQNLLQDRQDNRNTP